MAAHTFIEIGKQLLLANREDYIPELATLFTERELRDEGDDYGYVSTAGEVRDRLQLHGFTASRSRQELETAVKTWHEGHPELGFDDLDVPVRDVPSILYELGRYVNSSDQFARYDEPEDVFLKLDTRSILRLALDLVADPHLPVRYRLDDLVSWGMLARGAPICDQARADRQQNMARDAPLVVLTEGSSDSQLLTEAVSVTHPHLVGFLRFMDFSGGAQGSAADLVKLVRSFLGAGIANRVVAIADNDTSAHDALEKLKREVLPDSCRVLHYPEIPLLRRYPTLGPQLADPVLMDVNGKAGSLEMYLGRDVLTVEGELVPVQWTGYVPGKRSYQGAIAAAEKVRVQGAFRKKVKAARQNPAVRANQDWSGVEAIVETILRAFD